MAVKPYADELHRLAGEYVMAKINIADLQTQASDVRNRIDHLQEDIRTIEKKFLESVGDNVRTRVFQVDDNIVMIEHERGVFVHKIQKL